MALRHRLTTILPLRSFLAAAVIVFRTETILDWILVAAAASLEMDVKEYSG